MMESRVELLSFWSSPFAIRVELALAAKGIPYQKLEQDLTNKSQLLLDSNPIHKKVPVLIHNGKPICESSIIVQYIDDKWPDGCQIMPKDPYELAMARFWVDFVDTKGFRGLIFFVASEKVRLCYPVSMMDTMSTTKAKEKITLFSKTMKIP